MKKLVEDLMEDLKEVLKILRLLQRVLLETSRWVSRHDRRQCACRASYEKD